MKKAVKNQNHPKHKLATVQNTRKSQAENYLQNKGVLKNELSPKSVKAKIELKESKGKEAKGTLDKKITRKQQQLLTTK